MGMQMNRGDPEIPRWVAQTLVDRAAKRGKGQQPVLVGAMYRGQHEHAALKAGGNDLVQLKVAQLGVATSSEKYVVAHSAHTQVRFIAVTWENLPSLESVMPAMRVMIATIGHPNAIGKLLPNHVSGTNFNHPLRVFFLGSPGHDSEQNNFCRVCC